MEKIRLKVASYVTYVTDELEFTLDPRKDIEVSATIGPDGGTAVVTQGAITKRVAVHPVSSGVVK